MHLSLSALSHPGLQRRVRALVLLSGAGLVLPWASRFEAGLPPALGWLLDLAVHWQWFFLAGLLVALPLLMSMAPRWAIALLLLPLPWLSGLPAAPGRAADGAVLIVAGANVHVGNPRPERLVEWVTRTAPDIVAVFEVSDDYAGRLDLEAAYPYRVVRPRWDPFGVALLSRHPLKSLMVVDDPGATPRIEAVLDWNGTEVTVVAFHPMPPISAEEHAQRNRALAEIARRLGGRPTIVIGDFNATPWSSAFAVPRREGFARVGGLRPTWPAAGQGVAGLPIDQILVSRHWAAVGHAVGPDIGSDHLPVVATVTPVGQGANGEGR
ncbi:hypothetical protein GPA22_16355 [Aromatoleum toluvorans]|uniref:Endonuclease/exonuclease/phosphatase domain-containing protein n=1 Tax=Aromatoleum toluvorans TaxID=92002 RepID=A0ABX1Q0R7_9RHOO|nr:endonuclease/exonuclease/phosphatase family protein [Aromatoleum toluvorans]NMG45288.1 hypothetical protein [Aromatoleum toluvorans]